MLFAEPDSSYSMYITRELSKYVCVAVSDRLSVNADEDTDLQTTYLPRHLCTFLRIATLTRSSDESSASLKLETRCVFH